ncbi:hypothetical protein P170DRAFT_475103 [Aspergillus steynii IBT 23096]|uniref:Uncharacterized protein n=1 Tax=Aspergillus steynii IBT 23096 TaxID=1392250 RepID=A0A2I2G7D0_9EURO|nr:uncharacterized protein P170DRAFT_475103 [Aspergillus steynii IBT 23096]PLB48761.1 hypothetical protein P170DRAFT_475103 [Aspergillus steynii IBT 23096]
MPLDIFVPTLLGVVIASMVDTACFEKNSPSGFAILNWEGVRANDPDILLDGILVGVDVVQTEEGLSLLFSERIDLLADAFLQFFVAQLVAVMRGLDNGLFAENSRAL